MRGLMFKKARVVSGILGMTMLALFAVCTKDNPVQPGVNDTWKISGNVQDGYTGVYIDSAMVEYPDRNGKIVNIATTKNGDFTCKDLPYGNATITVKRQKGTVPYTTTVLTIPSGPKVSAIGDTNNAVYKFRDTSIVVKLFSLNGTVTGTVQAQKHARAPLVIGPGVPVKITYLDPDMQYASPRSFNTMTGTDGSFKFDSLPLANNAILTVLSATVGGVNYYQKIDTLADLTKGAISAGTIVLDMPISEMSKDTKFRILSTNFPNLQILPTGTMTWTLSGKPDSSVSYAVIQPDSASGALAKTSAVTKALYSVSQNTFSVTPATALMNGSTYYVTIFVYGDQGGYASDTEKVKVNVVGVEEVTASNVLTATKEGISGLGLNDSMSFTMKDSLIQATASVKHVSGSDTIVDLVTVTVSSNNILIKPKGSWLAATAYIVNVSGTLADGTPVSFQATVTTEGKLDFAASNVFDPQNPTQGKNGFLVKDSIVVTANKPLSAASAILSVSTAGGTQVPVAVSVSGSKVVVKPQSVLNFATTYVLQFSMTSTTGEVKATSVSFSTVASGFYLVSSNACIGGDQTKPVLEFDPAEAITITMSDSVGSATATLVDTTSSPAAPIAVSTSVAGQIITIKPTQGPLTDSRYYSLHVSASSAKGVKATVDIVKIKTRSELYVVWTNVRMGTDYSKPVLNFDPLDNIKVVMSKRLAKATAQVIDSATGNIVYSTVTIKVVSEGVDTIVIDPQTALIEGKAYNVAISVEDVDGLQYSGTLVMGLRPVKGVFIVASNVQTKDQGQLNNVPINTTPWYKLSVAPVASSIKATVTGNKTTGSIDNTVTVDSDTLFVAPSSPFHYGETVIVSFNGMATNGKSINLADTFTCVVQNPIRVVWSNVLNANLDGLTGVAVNQPIKVLLSASPKAGTITKTDVAGAMGNAVITCSGDTIVVTPVTNLNYQTGYQFTLNGMDANGIAFSVTVPPAVSATFTTTQNVFVVASNLLDANGVPLKTFPRYGTMWIKFSEALSTVKSQYTWANYAIADAFVSSSVAIATADVTAGAEIIGDGTSQQPNATVRISNDTLFVTPDNRVAIGYNVGVGFDVTITTALGKTKTFGAAVKTAPLNLYIVATNTKDASGNVRQDFGLRDTVWVKSSVAIDSLLGVHSVGATTLPDAAAGAGLLRARTWLSATKDTIFYVPSAKLSSGNTYGMNFDVRLSGESVGMTPHNGVLGIGWTTSAGVVITAINNLTNSTTFRQMKVIGDSLVVSFSKAIDTSFNAPTPFAVGTVAGAAFPTRYTKTWSADLKTVTIKNLDTLNARGYSINAADLTTNITSYDYQLNFNVTCADGEEKSGLLGSNQYVGVTNLKTEYKLALIGSNTVNGHTTAAAIDAGTDIAKDTFGLAGTPTLVFSRAIDTAKIKTDAVNQYQNYILLKDTTVSAVPIQFNLAFSTDAKTVTITPVNPLVAGMAYNIKVGAVQKIAAVGLQYSDGATGPAADQTILTSHDFKALPNADTLITALTDTIIVDTVAASANILGNRNGYSANDTDQGATAGAGIQPTGQFKISIHKAQWGPHYADSINGYQIRVRNQPHGTGAWSDWYILSANYSAGSAYNPFSQTVNTADAWQPTTVNVTGDASYAALLVAKPNAGYDNPLSMLNNGTIVQVQTRAFKNISSGKSFAQWSNTVAFADNVAPGDSDYTTWPNLNANACSLATIIPGGLNLNRTGLAPDTSIHFDVVFPEDMDVTTTTVPTISFYNGNNTGAAGPAVDPTKSGWQNARQYRIYLILAGGVDYTFATAGFYYKVSVAGMKDYSGITVQTTGTAPSPVAANGTTYAAMGGTTAPTYGTTQIGKGRVAVPDPKPGYYTLP